MIPLLIAVALITFISTANTTYVKDNDLVDYRSMISPKAISPFLGKDDCSNDNVLVCQDCTSVGLCITDGNGGWNVIDGGRCGDGETCLKGTCTKEANPACSSNLDFICTSTGVFPNQEDCKLHHFCVKNSDNQLTVFNELCTENYAYHPKTTYCSKKLKMDECNYYPVPLCKKLGEIAPLKNNPVLYYVCIRRTVPGSNVDVLYPVMHACEHGRCFDKYSGKCKSK